MWGSRGRDRWHSKPDIKDSEEKETSKIILIVLWDGWKNDEIDVKKNRRENQLWGEGGKFNLRLDR